MWRNKNVWILLTGEFIAGLGLWLGVIGNLEFLQEKVHSDFLKSLLLASGLLAGIAIGPFAGRFTDQKSKKTVMLIAGVLRIISVIFMLIAIKMGSIWWMAAFLVLLQISAAFYFPALQTAIPLIVKEKDLVQLNGVQMNVSTLSRIIGTAAGGFFLVIIPLPMLYVLTLLAYVFLFIITWFLNFEERENRSVKEERIKLENLQHNVENASFSDVFPIMKGIPIVYITLMVSLIPNLFLGSFNLMVINISELQQNSAIKAWLYAAEGSAFMLGAFTIKQITDRIPSQIILYTCSFLIGLSQVLLYFANLPLLAVIAFLLFGFSVGCFYPTAAAIFQIKVPRKFHGRFFSFRNMFDRLTFQIFLVTSGFLLDLIGLQLMNIIFGSLSMILTLLFFAKNRTEKLSH